jgi:SHS2 domain-containing protein
MLTESQIAVMRSAYATATVEEIKYARDRAAHCKAKDSENVLQELLEEKIALDDKQPSVAEWAETVAPKKKPLTAKEKREKEERRIEGETRGGRDLPRPCEPHSEFANQTEYILFRASTAPPAESPYACLDCRENYRAPTCTGACSDPKFFRARRMTHAEFATHQSHLAAEARRHRD